MTDPAIHLQYSEFGVKEKLAMTARLCYEAMHDLDVLCSAVAKEASTADDTTLRRLAELTQQNQELRRKVANHEETIRAQGIENRQLRAQSSLKSEQIRKLEAALKRPVTDDREFREIDTLMRTAPKAHD